MRFDLTNASFRVLQRAAEFRFSGTASQVFAGKLLIALFEEDESRAAVWLAEAGLTRDRFYEEFGLHTLEAKLQSPISAPMFPMGDYGVPPSPVSEAPSGGSSRIGKAAPDGNAPPVDYPDPDNPPPEEETEPAKTPARPAYRREPDQWTASEEGATPARSKTYSLYPPFRADSKYRSAARFYVDDLPVSIGASLAMELEENLATLLQRFSHRDGQTQRRRIPASGGGALAVDGGEGSLSPTGLSFATEHLLLAVVMDRGDVGDWLRENGFDAAELYERISAIGTGSPAANVFEPLQEDFSNDFEFPPDFETQGEEPPQPTESVSERKPPGESRREDRRLHRLIDAAANRAREAVRVIEDFARFMLDDPALTRQLKVFRHEFQSALDFLPIHARLEARDTEQDVGTEIEGAGEYRRRTIHDVLAANFSRLQESLRSLEEFAKLHDPESGRRFERLRYRCYTLHKIVALAETSPPTSVSAAETGTPPSLENDRLYALLDTRADEDAFRETALALIEGGVTVIQLRDKKADDRTLLARALLLRRLIDESEKRVLMIVNDRPDLALLTAADGVHVGQEEIPFENLRRLVGPKMLIGVSTHDIGQARAALLDGADYIGAGPVFDSSTKSFDKTVGTEFLREVAAEIAIPAFAIGGIDAENLDQVLETGIGRVALGAALLNAPDIRKAAGDFAARLFRLPLLDVIPAQAGT